VTPAAKKVGGQGKVAKVFAGILSDDDRRADLSNRLIGKRASRRSKSEWRI